MPINLKIVETPKNSDKRLRAIFRLHTGGPIIKIVDFGVKKPKIGTYIDHGDEKIRKNYIARHEVNEKKFYKDPQRAATLSRFILWGSSSNLKKNIEDYKKKFNLS